MEQVCILLADDHQLFVDGISHILKKLADEVEITAVSDAQQTIDAIESGQEFDLILLDLDMPGMDGLSILQRMHERGHWLPIVVVSGTERVKTIKDALDYGALGFVPKAHNSQQMLDAMRAVLEGDIYVPEDIQKQIDNLESQRVLKTSESNIDIKSFGITSRQHSVLKLMAKGYSNKEICTSLFLSEHTVKAHVSALFKHLNAKNRTNCVQIAQSEGLLFEQREMEV